MRRYATGIGAIAVWLAATAAHAQAPSFQVDQLYSNADGTIQFVVLHEKSGQNGQNHLAGVALHATGTGHDVTFTFDKDLPGTQTSRHYVLLATQGYVDAAVEFPEFGSVTPDYILPVRFLATGAGSVTFAGVDTLQYDFLPADGTQALYRAGDLRDNRPQDFGGSNVTLPVTRVTAVEYYNAALDHYFISDLAPDIEALDSQRIAGWARTGKTIPVWPNSFGLLNGVCRFYIPPEHGNSHFFSASATECHNVSGLVGTDPNYSGYVLETTEAFFVALPFADGTCPTHWLPVYRLWNNRPDSNHRYTMDPAIKAEMLARGYIAEGYGPDAVAMCSPL
jgi:hypothetical protein